MNLGGCEPIIRWASIPCIEAASTARYRTRRPAPRRLKARQDLPPLRGGEPRGPSRIRPLPESCQPTLCLP